MGNSTQQMAIKPNKAPLAPSMEDAARHIMTQRKPRVLADAPNYQSHLWGT